MDIMQAFIAMLDDIHAADVSDGQETGIITWHQRSGRAASLAAEMDANPESLKVTFFGSLTHRPWRTTGRSILTALAAQVDEARFRRAEAEREANTETARQANAAAARAVEAQGQAAHARRLAAMAGEQYAAGFRAQADAFDAQAAAARDAEKQARDKARKHANAAEEHRKRASALRLLAKRLLRWEAAAQDAYGTGVNLIQAQNRPALEMFQAVQAAGGRHEAPASKWYLTVSGKQLAATAGKGGGAQ
jgi:hypothetical protein